MARRKKKVMRTPKAARRAARKRRSGVAERRKKEFTYRGMTVAELQALPMFAPDDDPDLVQLVALQLDLLTTLFVETCDVAWE